MARAFLIVIDSVGIGGAPDADQFFNGDLPDTGANTVAHIAQTAGLDVPVMDALGLGAAVTLASGDVAPGLGADPTGAWGAAREISRGKDTPSGHWELAGVPVPWDWHVFTDKQNSFPENLVAQICAAAGTEGILGNCHASGTAIIEQEGAAHVRSGWPICYTSADSVLQIAAHEEHFGLDRLLQLCADIAPTLHAMKVGRVIARPFAGDVGSFARTANRKDFAIAPPAPTICDYVHQAGRKVHAVGKIGDIFSMRGIDDLRKGRDVALMGHIDDLVDTAEDGAFVFANLVEFDSEYGHRRDPAGYAAHLAWFDRRLGQILPRLRPDDLLIVTADHGNDPTWPGTDHTREQVPVLVHGLGARALGPLQFVDVAASIAAHLNVEYDGEGQSFL
ncbi:phosphopentomutase [Yoonia tamlensis]|uniref:Phosphopentomutase n=1 Tax=Yoonia tamlensis TaxID=390270 RepID=A0A1I6GPQ9_9RHOB|nr:phosphopentomutase [Yoonia tamlensis]SFR44148.1 phosphopentomutase [Yoonia tamlensis]